MRKRSLIGGLVAAATLLGLADTASAIRFGEPDAEEHPYVGLMVAFIDDVPQWRCSGTMISPTVFLTAGHCTYGADHVEIWFDEDLRDAGAVNYPFVGDVGGTPHTHPDYSDGTFWMNDVGVVVLAKRDAVDMGTYGTLPQIGYLDEALAETGSPQLFEVVGYGLQRNSPVAAQVQADRVRLKATVRLVNDDRVFGGRGDGVYAVFSNNANTGGTCNGDSGGPVFINDTTTIVAVTSFGMNVNCAGAGGAYRIDTAEDLAWITSFMRR